LLFVRLDFGPGGRGFPNAVDAPIAVEILIIVVLVLLNGVLSGAEIAIVSFRRTRLRELVESGSRSAQVVLQLRDNPERFLATVQVGITIIGATAGAFGGATFAHDLEPLVARIPGLTGYARQISLVVVVLLVSYLTIVLGELIPKSLALRSPERFSLLMARPLLWLSWIARPIVWFLTASSNAALRPFKDQTTFLEARVSPDELQQLVDEASKSGALNPKAGMIASRALVFGELTVTDVMVPRTQVIAIDRRATPDQLRQALLEEGHTRLPVYDGNIDQVVGYLSMKEVLALGWERELLIVEDLLRPAYFVPQTKRAIDLLEDMRERRVPFAIVVDEQGGMAGIVTIEDLLEELVGEIMNEHVRAVDEPIHREPDGSARIFGMVPVREVNRALGFELPEEGSWTTIAGLCLGIAGRIPAVGDLIATANGYLLEILDASPRRIRSIRITRMGHPQP
jgi:putative hemolysin